VEATFYASFAIVGIKSVSGLLLIGMGDLLMGMMKTQVWKTSCGSIVGSVLLINFASSEDQLVGVYGIRIGAVQG